MASFCKNSKTVCDQYKSVKDAKGAVTAGSRHMTISFKKTLEIAASFFDEFNSTIVDACNFSYPRTSERLDETLATSHPRTAEDGETGAKNQSLKVGKTDFIGSQPYSRASGAVVNSIVYPPRSASRQLSAGGTSVCAAKDKMTPHSCVALITFVMFEGVILFAVFVKSASASSKALLVASNATSSDCGDMKPFFKASLAKLPAPGGNERNNVAVAYKHVFVYSARW